MATSPDPVSILDQHLFNLNGEAFMNLSLSLTMAEGGLGGRNWEGVAGKLGMNMGQVDLLKRNTESHKGWLLLNTWGHLETGATVRKLIIALESLKMKKCIDTLREAISDDNIESAKNQCAELIKNGRLYNHFPSYTDTQFSKALYPHLHKDDHTQHLQHPPFPQPGHVHPWFSETSTVQEDLPQSSQDAPAEPERPRLVPKSVFISYCPEYDEAGLKLHNKLKDLAESLNEYGYTIYYDKYCTEGVRRCGGVDLWKEAHIRKSENILVICTPEYFQDDEMALMEHKDSKIAVDRKLLRSIAYSSSSQDRLIPVLLDAYRSVRNCIPSFVQASPLHFWPSKKQDLMLYLAKQSKYKLPEVLEKKVVQPIVIQVPPRPRVVQQRLQPQSQIMRERKFVKPRVVEVPRTKEQPKTQSKSSKSHDKKGRKLFPNPFSRTNKGQK